MSHAAGITTQQDNADVNFLAEEIRAEFEAYVDGFTPWLLALLDQTPEASAEVTEAVQGYKKAMDAIIEAERTGGEIHGAFSARCILEEAVRRHGLPGDYWMGFKGSINSFGGYASDIIDAEKNHANNLKTKP